MDPELLEELRKALTAQRRGVSRSRVDSVVSERTDFGSLRSLAEHARDQGVAREEIERDLPPPAPSPQAGPQASPTAEDDGGLFAGMGRVGRIAGDVMTLGLLDEAAATAAGVGAAIVPGGKGFSEAREAELQASRQRLQQAQEGAGLGTKAVGILGGALAAPGTAAGRFIARGGGALARAGRGAAAGAAEGGIFGFGSAEGSISERLPEAGKGAAIGAATGAALPVAVDAARAVGRGLRGVKRTGGQVVETARRAKRGFEELDRVEELERTIGPRLGQEMREGAGILGRPSRIRAEVAKARKGIFGELDEIEEIADEPLQKALQADEVAPYVPEEVATSKRPPSFPEAQGAVLQMRDQARQALRTGDAASFQALTNAQRKVGKRLDDAVEGFGEANAAYKQHMDRIRALEAGEDVATGSADDMRAAFTRLDTDVERDAFREGLGSHYLARLDDIKAIPSTLKKIQNAPETRAKLRVLFPEDEAFESFVAAARRAEDVRETAKAGRVAQRELMRNLFTSLAKGVGIGAAGAAGAGILSQ